jgi:uncharacterized membrane protein
MKKMKKSQKVLWVLTIINSTILFLFLLFLVLSYIFPPEDELREWVSQENKATLEYVNKETEKQREYVNSETQKLYDWVNKNWR